MKDVYFETIRLIKRLHRQFLEVVKGELDRIGVEDSNNIQALILANIGREEPTAGELTNRGYYLGSNVSYNVKMMVENGYLEQERSAHDRRSVRVKVSEKGLNLCDRIETLHQRHIDAMSLGVLAQGDLETLDQTLHSLERFWSDNLAYGNRVVPEDVSVSAA